MKNWDFIKEKEEEFKKEFISFKTPITVYEDEHIKNCLSEIKFIEDKEFELMQDLDNNNYEKLLIKLSESKKYWWETLKSLLK